METKCIEHGQRLIKLESDMSEMKVQVGRIDENVLSMKDGLLVAVSKIDKLSDNIGVKLEKIEPKVKRNTMWINGISWLVVLIAGTIIVTFCRSWATDITEKLKDEMSRQAIHKGSIARIEK